MFWTILHIVEIGLWIIMAASVAYVVFFAIISLFYEKDDFASTHTSVLNYRERRFLVLYPAYHEDSVIINSVNKFLFQDYPTDKFRLVVISDHMTDETNKQLRTFPITLLTPVFEKSSKAKAMQYAINYIEEKIDTHEEISSSVALTSEQSLDLTLGSPHTHCGQRRLVGSR